MKNKTKLLCTLGPASLNEKTIVRLDEVGVDVFRINLSHTPLEKVAPTIELIQKFTRKPVCLDSEGAQVRTAYMENNGVVLEENSTVEVTSEVVLGDRDRFTLTPDYIVPQIKTGDLISVDFDSVLLQVIGRNGEVLKAKVISGGMVGSNKAVTVDRRLNMPVMSEKDKAAIRIGRKYDVTHYALSFASSREAVEEFRALTGKEAFVISKIESKLGLENLEGICGISNALLIDRGDLSREEPIDKIPFIQKLIIQRAKARNIPVYVATNLLESMVKSKKPTRAEANDVINTLLDGASGLVLAAETAIGAYPVNCAAMISRMMMHCEEISEGKSLEELQRKESFLLIEPHGGVLINRFRENSTPEGFRRLEVDEGVILDAEQIALGTFSPLEGFMTEAELDSVLKTYRLPNGVVWPLPITLQIQDAEAKGLKEGETVSLALKESGDIHARLHIGQIYAYDLDRLAQEAFGTRDESHPGVRALRGRGPVFIGGKVDLIKRLPSEHKHYEITPRQSRMIFENKGWSRVVGFHTRNVIHRAHEHIQMLAFEQFHCDGLLVHPVVGPKKKGDYQPEVILKGYEVMMDRHYPKGKVVLAAFQSYSRYCGPREAVFTALCRKNFGCSHFVVGRDHTGVGDFYAADASQKLFEQLGDIGIKPIFFNTMNYCRKCDRYVDHCGHDAGDRLDISGTEGREMLKSARLPPEWFMRKDVSEVIIDAIKRGGEVFVP